MAGIFLDPSKGEVLTKLGRAVLPELTAYSFPSRDALAAEHKAMSDMFVREL
jgi:hypothetical protein